MPSVGSRRHATAARGAQPLRLVDVVVGAERDHALGEPIRPRQLLGVVAEHAETLTVESLVAALGEHHETLAGRELLLSGLVRRGLERVVLDQISPVALRVRANLKITLLRRS